ncbi:hypothetical protein [Oscillatoria acuminata]|uniref:hypothetical protein n=1 Tax=Oscillatoria acuminata TaxID=118323 RepID=UPI0012EA7652|nr:hypothetical protein [Oscillatoria acuminata]
MMVLKIVLLIIWAFFVGYVLQLHPLEQSGSLTLIEKMVKLQLNDVNSYAFTLFSFMGVWPLVYGCLMFIDERMQPLPAWPSFLASNGSGVIGMMPYIRNYSGGRGRRETDSECKTCIKNSNTGRS